jgi:hypothetical protein
MYILNGNFPNVFLVDENPIPIDGQLYLEHPPIVLALHQHDPNWEEEQNGVVNNLSVFGANPHHDALYQIHLNVTEQLADANPKIDGQVEDIDEDKEDPWPEWNPAIPVVPEPQQPPQHLVVPQYFIDLDLSSSSMRFLRASGPDISLDEVL